MNEAELERLDDHQICLRFNKSFVKQNRIIAQEIYNAISYSCENSIYQDELSENENENVIFSKVLQQIEDKSIKERLHESVNQARLEILNSDVIRKQFFRKIELISFKKYNENGIEKTVFNEEELWLNINNEEVKRIWDSKEGKARKHWSWESVKTMLEAFQSTILNQYSFCDSKGFFLYKLSAIFPKYYGDPKKINGYLIISSKDSSYDESIINVYNNLLRAISAQYIKLVNKHSGNLLKNKKMENHLMEEITRELPVLNFGDANFEDTKLKRWIDIVCKMSEESIHESKNLEFLIGIGPKAYHEIHFKKYILPFDHLVSPISDGIKIIHFLKSYYSLFESSNNRIIWFDEYCHFLGIYEFNDETELFKKSKDKMPLFAKIKGRNQFELIYGKNPIIRVKDGVSINLNNNDEIEKAIVNATHKCFYDYPWIRKQFSQDKFTETKKINKLIDNFSHFVSSIVNKTKIEGYGSSYIVVNEFFGSSTELIKKEDANVEISDWKVEFESQSKNLSERLTKHSSPIISIEDLLDYDNIKNQEIFDDVLNEVLLLSRLDGSILVRLKSDGVYVSPSQFAVPLVVNKGQTIHFDYFDLRNNGRLKVSCSESINEKFYNNKVTTFEELQAFISDIDTGKGFNRENLNFKELTFLNSSGTRHHSLYGLSLTVIEPLYMVVLSEDGKIRVFWNGLIFNSLN